ncbi:MAG: polyphosphate kinase 2 family protein, partial [Frankiales bacterium]|nr:polyphosphate kinase 2 family protein [Frankiales bacterium]
MTVARSIGALLKVAPGGVRLQDLDPRSTPGFDGDKDQGKAETAALGERLAQRQEQLYAAGRAGGRRRVLVVLQGMDTAGKGGAVKTVAGLVNPAGLRITGFGKPTPEELEHDFLWRFDQALPGPGLIGFFDRSYYEDVLIVRVHDLVPEAEWSTRYDRINAWEAELAGQGVVLLKVMLHLSREEQRDRLLARLDDVTKHWKVNPGDITERGFWADYQQAYEVLLERCSTDAAPWHVLPADRKWYRDWALAHLLLE